METKDIKQLQDENKKLKKEYGKLLEELQRLRRFEKETKLPSSEYMKRLQETDLRKRCLMVKTSPFLKAWAKATAGSLCFTILKR